MRTPPRNTGFGRRQIQHNKDLRLLKDAVYQLQDRPELAQERGVEHYYATLPLQEEEQMLEVPGSETDTTKWNDPVSNSAIISASYCETPNAVILCITTSGEGKAQVVMVKPDTTTTDPNDYIRKIVWHLTILGVTSSGEAVPTTTTTEEYDETGTQDPTNNGAVPTPNPPNLPDGSPGTPGGTPAQPEPGTGNTRYAPSGLAYVNNFRTGDRFLDPRTRWFQTYPTHPLQPRDIHALTNANTFDDLDRFPIPSAFTDTITNPRGIGVSSYLEPPPSGQVFGQVHNYYYFLVEGGVSSTPFRVVEFKVVGTGEPDQTTFSYTPSNIFERGSDFATTQPVFKYNSVGRISAIYMFYQLRQGGALKHFAGMFGFNHTTRGITRRLFTSFPNITASNPLYVGAVELDGRIYGFPHYGNLSNSGWAAGGRKVIKYKAFNPLENFASDTGRDQTFAIASGVEQVGKEAAWMSGSLIAISTRKSAGWTFQQERFRLPSSNPSPTSPPPNPPPAPRPPVRRVVLSRSPQEHPLRVGTTQNPNTSDEYTLFPLFTSTPNLANRDYDLLRAVADVGGTRTTLSVRTSASGQAVDLRWDNRTWGVVELRSNEDDDSYTSRGLPQRQAKVRLALTDQGGRRLPSNLTWRLTFSATGSYSTYNNSIPAQSDLTLDPYYTGSSQLAPGGVAGAIRIARPDTETTAHFGDWFELPEEGEVLYTASSSEDTTDTPLFSYTLNPSDLSVRVAVPEGTAPSVGGAGWIEVRAETTNIDTGLPVAVSVRAEVLIIPLASATPRSGVVLVIPPGGTRAAQLGEFVDYDTTPSSANIQLSDFSLSGSDTPIGLEVLPPSRDDNLPQRLVASDNVPGFNSASETADAVVDLTWDGGHEQQVSVPFTARTNAVEVQVRNNFPASTNRTMNTWIHPYNHTGYLDLARYHFNRYSSYDLDELVLGYSYRLTAEADRYFDVRFDLPDRPGHLVVHRHNSANWTGTIPIYVSCVATAPNGDTHQVEKTLFYRSH